jgi:hypothetical protein
MHIVFVEKSFSDGLYFVNKNGQRKQHLYSIQSSLFEVYFALLFIFYIFILYLLLSTCLAMNNVNHSRQKCRNLRKPSFIIMFQLARCVC